MRSGANGAGGYGVLPLVPRPPFGILMCGTAIWICMRRLFGFGPDV